MLLKAIQGIATASDADLITEMHRLRARVFHDRLEWDVTIVDGEERDDFDCLAPTYILALTDDGTIAGSARLLPATGPTMLERAFPQLLRDGRLNAHPAMIESSRFCVDTSLEGRESGALHRATLAMFAGIIDWSMAHGYSAIATATDIRFERILKRAGWPLQRLGDPSPIGNTMAVAGVLPADVVSFMRLCPDGYRSEFTSRQSRVA